MTEFLSSRSRVATTHMCPRARWWLHEWEGQGKPLSNEEREQLARDVDQALRQGAILAGKLGANVPRDIADALEAKVDWREALREFVTSFCAEKDESTWRKPSRRWIGEDVYMPSLIGESVGRLVVAIDMSGSIGHAEVAQFLGEVRKICDTVKPEGIDLLYWDTEVAGHEVYNRGDFESLMASTKPAGGGGTMVECVTEYMREKQIKPQAAIILTDGYLGGSWGTWHVPVLWCVLDNASATPNVGKTVHIESSTM